MRYLLPMILLMVAQVFQSDPEPVYPLFSPHPGIVYPTWEEDSGWWPSPNPVEFPGMEPGETLVITVPPDMADTMIIYIPSNNYTITEADTVWIHKANVMILLDDIKVLRERTIYEELK